MSREMIKDESLDKVVGGYMNFNYNTKILTYTHEETKNKTTYEILDFEKAWKTSSALHGENVHEDIIIAEMLTKGYIR